jgi:hypothetical protein
MFQRASLALMVAAGLPLSPALAQPAPAASAASASAGKTSAETAAMERAQRMAANPMRVILEASKFRRRSPVEGADAAPVEAGDGSLRRTAARANEPVASPAPAATEVAPRSVPAPVVKAPEPPNVLLTTSSDLATAPASQAVPALEASRKVTEAVVLPDQLAAPQAGLAAALEAPRLRKSVEPAIPPRLLSEVSRLTEVLADVTIRRDGTVAAVTLITNVPRSLQQPITDALAQWQFEPLRSMRVHRVQLLFSEQ